MPLTPTKIKPSNSKTKYKIEEVTKQVKNRNDCVEEEMTARER